MIHGVLGFLMRDYEPHRVAVVVSAGRYLSPAWCLAQEHGIVCVGTLSQRQNMSPNKLGLMNF